MVGFVWDHPRSDFHQTYALGFFIIVCLGNTDGESDCIGFKDGSTPSTPRRNRNFHPPLTGKFASIFCC